MVGVIVSLPVIEVWTFPAHISPVPGQCISLVMPLYFPSEFLSRFLVLDAVHNYAC
jgi:hypothetical protein